MSRLLIRGGRVLDPASGRDEVADVLLANGVVEAVGARLSAADAEVIDATGCWVAPGFIDLHTHLREPGQEYKEDMFPAIFINPGDVTLMTVPGYPVMATHTRWYGGSVHALPLRRENGFLPDLDAVPAEVRKKAKLLYLNYPNNPTGAGATRAFFEKAVRFARENDIIVVQDVAYAALMYGSKPLSFLSVPGAKDVGVEIHSLSKAYNMTGWRLAFVAGNERVVAGYATVKDNYDSGQFKAIQKAGVYALDHPGDHREASRSSTSGGSAPWSPR